MFRARHVRKARTMDRVSFRGCPRYSPAFSRPSNQVTREPTGRKADLYGQTRMEVGWWVGGGGSSGNPASKFLVTTKAQALAFP
jgi:hypothetical protein